MDIFNKKKVEELEEELRNVKNERDSYRSALGRAESEIRYLLEVQKTIPEDCVPGEYCRSCEFSKRYCYDSYIYGARSTTHSEYICNKGKSCQNFVQKKVGG